MTSRTRFLTVLMVAALGASGCSTLHKINPFHGSTPKETASEGERISIIPAEQRLEPTEALKGVDFALPTATPVAEWPVPGGTLAQSIENVDAAPSLSIAWKRSIGRGSGGGFFVTAPPVSAAGRIYVMDADASVSAHDARSGAQIWRTNIRPNDGRRDREAFGGGVAFADGKLYASSGYREVVQLDAATGAIGWRARTEEPIHAAPTVADGRVMVVSLDNVLLTFDAATGAPGWTYQALSEPARILAASSPAVFGETVVASFGSGELVALRAQNGVDLWNAALSRSSQTNALSEIRDIPGRPVVYQGDVFAVSHSGVFAATDIRSGQTRWTLPVVGVTTPWAAGDVVYVVSRDGQLICVSRENGQIYWMRDLNGGLRLKKAGGFLGFGRHEVKPLWSSPILANNRIIVASSSGDLASVNAKTGAVEKRMSVGAPILMAPIAVGGMIYMVNDSGQLIALR